MMKPATLFSVLILIFNCLTHAQDLNLKLSQEISRLEKDQQFKHAFLAMEVLDAVTGKPVFSYNAQKLMVPASTQKLLTASGVLEKFGADYRLKTEFRVSFSSSGKNILWIRGNYDPTLGSSRWPGNTAKNIITNLLAALEKQGLQKIDSIIINNEIPGFNLPRGWVWEDIGNYYGAGADRFNWRENAFDIHLRSSITVGSPVKIISHDGPANLSLQSFLTAGDIGTGDNAYVFHSPNDSFAFIKGTIPPGENDFKISASATGPSLFISDLKKSSDLFSDSKLGFSQNPPQEANLIYTQQSPPLDSMVYWFLKKSINLYGESFIGILSPDKYENGIRSLVTVLNSMKLDIEGLVLMDGSGLSPGNRISPSILTSVIFQASKKKWWNDFYDALPVMNGLHMKDGYITGYRSYAGMVKNNQGKEFIFCLMTNGYSGSPSAAREKLWKLLDLLK